MVDECFLMPKGNFRKAEKARDSERARAEDAGEELQNQGMLTAAGRLNGSPGDAADRLFRYGAPSTHPCDITCDTGLRCMVV